MDVNLFWQDSEGEDLFAFSYSSKYSNWSRSVVGRAKIKLEPGRVYHFLLSPFIPCELLLSDIKEYEYRLRLSLVPKEKVVEEEWEEPLYLLGAYKGVPTNVGKIYLEYEGRRIYEKDVPFWRVEIQIWNTSHKSRSLKASLQWLDASGELLGEPDTTSLGFLQSLDQGPSQKTAYFYLPVKVEAASYQFWIEVR